MLCAQTQPIPYVREIEVDGLLNDWQSIEPASVFQTENDDDNNKNKVYVGWNEEFLFVAFHVEDHKLIELSTDALKLHLNDGIELYIDPKNDSRSRMDVNDYQFIVTALNRSNILKGDLYKIRQKDIRAPKESGISTIVYKTVAAIEYADLARQKRTGYAVEIQIPFAAIGIQPKAGYRLKMDMCNNDADSSVNIGTLPEGEEIPAYHFSNYKGDTDFSLPENWAQFELQGGPSQLDVITREHYGKILIVALIFLLCTFVFVFLLIRRIRQLKNIPQKSTLQQNGPLQTHLFTEAKKRSPEVVASELTHEASEEENIRNKAAHQVIEHVKSYVLAHLDKDLSVEMLSNECGVSVRGLQRIFKDSLEITPIQFVSMLKLEEAIRRIKKGEFTISEVAYQLGYNDPAYFTRAFKKYFGFPPRETSNH